LAGTIKDDPSLVSSSLSFDSQTNAGSNI
jgi:hypothetical protein